MRTQEQREAAKRRREARKLKKQQEISTLGGFEDRTVRRSTSDPKLLSETMIIAEIKRIPILEQNWDYNMTIPVKKEMMRMILADIDAGEKDELSTMAFDALYILRDQGKVIPNSGCLGSAEDVLENKREKRLMRKARKLKEKGVTPSNYRSELKSENNPLQSSGSVVRSNHGQQPERKTREIKGDTTMILTNTSTNSVYKFKVRSKGAPAYAESGDNRPAKIDGKEVNFVLNPKQENNKSKRVGFNWNGKWYFVDDETVHAEVKGSSPKKTIVLEAKKSAEKPAKKAKAEKEEGSEKPAAKGSKKAAAKEPAKKAAPKAAKGGKKAAETPAE